MADRPKRRSDDDLHESHDSADEHPCGTSKDGLRRRAATPIDFEILILSTVCGNG